MLTELLVAANEKKRLDMLFPRAKKGKQKENINNGVERRRLKLMLSFFFPSCRKKKKKINKEKRTRVHRRLGNRPCDAQDDRATGKLDESRGDGRGLGAIRRRHRVFFSLSLSFFPFFSPLLGRQMEAKTRVIFFVRPTLKEKSPTQHFFFFRRRLFFFLFYFLHSRSLSLDRLYLVRQAIRRE